MNRGPRELLIAALLGLLVGLLLLFNSPDWLRKPEPVPAPAPSAAPPAAPPPVSEPHRETPPAVVASYAEAVKRAAPAVVNVYTRKRSAATSAYLDDPLLARIHGGNDEARRQRMQSSLGSGVIVSHKGDILTNHHVVANAEDILVLLRDGREAAARLVGADPETDLALLKIELTGLQPIELADGKQIEVGDVVLAIGNPFGVGQSVTFGIIGATGRAGLGLSTFENFIQTDAAIHPGNSGGALVNAEGRLVGINSAVYSQQGGGSLGIGFAIPAAVAYQVMQALIDHGRVVRGWLGIEVERVELPGAATAKVEGLRVTAVVSGSPAEQAGIAENDIITRLSGRESWNGRLAMEQIARARPGEQVRISVLRGSEPMELTATVGERPPAEP